MVGLALWARTYCPEGACCGGNQPTPALPCNSASGHKEEAVAGEELKASGFVFCHNPGIHLDASGLSKATPQGFVVLLRSEFPRPGWQQWLACALSEDLTGGSVGH